MVFLGILLDGESHHMAGPDDKKVQTLHLLCNFTDAKKATVKQIQGLVGLLNFLNKAIFPGRAFTRRMYSKYTGILENGKLRPHLHINLDSEFCSDCEVWKQFLSMDEHIVCRLFIDVSKIMRASDLGFFTDAVKSVKLGFGGIFGKEWIFGKWGPFIIEMDPSIEYLELFGVVIAVFAWSEKLQNSRIIIHCDNQSVVNNTSSSCKNCMILIRMLTLRELEFNMRIFTRWIRGAHNQVSNALSRLNFKRFWALTEGLEINPLPMPLPVQLWPPEKIWLSTN